MSGCFGGALSLDPLHCYVLEEAQREGIMDVAAVYKAGKGLLVYLNRPASVTLGDELHQYIERKAKERVRAVGGDACVLRDDNCDHGVFGIHPTGYLLPKPTTYENIELRTGGAEARRSEVGWPSYEQVWPPISSVAQESGSFDVSEVDMTDIPELNCEGWPRPNIFEDHYCDLRARYPDIGLAGYHSTLYHGWIQVKAPLAKEAETLAAVREAMFPWHPNLPDENFTLIPVKYDLDEFWRWTVILDRFAQSSGNTSGIVDAGIWVNSPKSLGEKSVFTAASGLSDAMADASAYRTTIHVWTLDVERTLAALPQLLPQLNIPVDAVGVVNEWFQGTVPRIYPHAHPMENPAQRFISW